MELKIIIEMGGKEVSNTKIDLPEKIEGQSVSQYARFFDETCAGWSKDPKYNLLFLRQTERYANDRLKAVGYLFLNEVYDLLGIPKTKEGQIVCWIYDEKNPIGDNFVDFGIYDTINNMRFINGYERYVLLDFNVDGNIFELIK